MAFPTMPQYGGILPGSYQPPSYQEWINYVMQNAGGAGQTAQQYLDAVGGGASPHAFIQPGLQRALEVEQEPMSQAQEVGERQSIRGNFNRMVGGLATRGARLGSYSPSSVATAAAGRPARSLAASYADLAARKAQMRQQGAAGAGGKYASLYGYPADEYKAGQEARGKTAASILQGQSQGWRQPTMWSPGIRQYSNGGW